MSQINVLKASMTPLVNLMSSSGVSVVFSGDDAKTEYNTKTGKPTKIYLPIINDDAPDHLCRVFHGYLDHEVGHVLFTDMTKAFDMLKEKDGIVKTVFNIIEDPRIENKICKRFRGSVFNLGNMHSFVFDEDHINSIPKDTSSDEYKLMSLIYVIRDISGQTYFREKVNDNPLLSLMKSKILHSFPEIDINKMNSEDVVELSQKICDLLDFKDKNPESKSKPKPTSGESKESCDLTSDAYTKHIKDKISSLAKDLATKNEYMIQTTEFDVIKHAPRVSNSRALDFFKQKSNEMTGVIRKNLERSISTKSLVVWSSMRRSGKLDNRALYKLSSGESRVFKRKAVSKSKDVAVSLLIDCSGSMRDQKIEIASTAAYALAEVLNAMNISFEILGFTTVDFGKHSAFRDLYARIAGLNIPIFKSFTDSWDVSAKERLAGLWGSDSLCNNVDGESVQIAYDRLKVQPKNGKILIVISDGEPAADGNDSMLYYHLKKTVAEIESKIDVVGIGVDSDSVEDFYKNSVVLNNIDELPKSVIQQIRKILLS